MKSKDITLVFIIIIIFIRDTEKDIMKNGKVPQNSIAIYGASVAVSLVLSYVESIIPINMGIPGAKIGLPNIVTIFLLYTAGARGALAVSVMRILLSGFMFGNMFSIVYSLSGLLLSFAGMVLLRQTGRFSTMGVSVMEMWSLWSG